MPSSFTGKVAVVTGGASGYGRGIVEKLRSEGAEVIIADLSKAAGSKTASELGCTFVHASVADRSGWASILSTTLETHGRLDVVVNNAGACYLKKPSETVTDDEFDLVMNVNVRALYHSVSVIVPHLLERGRAAAFVNVASASGIRPRAGLAWYGASKAAVNNASNCLAVEYASRGIRFNTVCPVVEVTPMTDILSDDERAEMAASVPLGRMCTPRDVGKAVAYLAGDEADFITGVNLQVDGGRCV